MLVDWTFRLSDLLVVLGFIGTTGMMLFRAGSFITSLRGLEQEIGILQKGQIDLTAAITQLAVQRTEIDHIREDIREMKHGMGFVQQRDALNGEYPR